MKFWFVQYLLIVVAIISIAGCAIYGEADLKRTPLMFAATQHDISTVRSLLIKDVDIDINAKDKKGHTALMHAASSGKVDIAKLLLDAGSDVNAKNKRHRTALMIAAWHGYIDMAEFLIDAGADVNLKDKDGETALWITIVNGEKRIACMLLMAGAEQ